MSNSLSPMQIDIGIIPILSRMMNTGIEIDLSYLNAISNSYGEQINDWQDTIDTLFGHHVNCDSSEQLIPAIRELGIYAENAQHDTLAPLAFDNPTIKMMLDIKSLSKLKGSFIDKFPKMVDRDCRLHTKYGITSTETGRITSYDPNLQQIPSKTPEGKAIRKAFVASKGYVLLGADFSQIEMRLLACESNDQVMLDLYAKGIDLHTYLASKIFKVSMEEVTKVQRKFAKNTNFMVGYGVTEQGLFNRLKSEGIKTSLNDCMKFIEAWFGEFKQAGEYFHAVHRFAEDHGYVENFLGRRRWVPEAYSSLKWVKSAGLRQAGNSPIQSGAAEIMKLAMIKLHKAMKPFSNEWKPLLTIHDEQCTEVKQELLSDAYPVLIDSMEKAVEMTLPFSVDCKVGDNWMEMESINS